MAKGLSRPAMPPPRLVAPPRAEVAWRTFGEIGLNRRDSVEAARSVAAAGAGFDVGAAADVVLADVVPEVAVDTDFFFADFDVDLAFVVDVADAVADVFFVFFLDVDFFPLLAAGRELLAVRAEVAAGFLFDVLADPALPFVPATFLF